MVEVTCYFLCFLNLCSASRRTVLCRGKQLRGIMGKCADWGLSISCSLHICIQLCFCLYLAMFLHVKSCISNYMPLYLSSYRYTEI